jgi:hypothetical protein
MPSSPSERGPNDQPPGRKSIPVRDPIQLADRTTASLQDRLDSITIAWREGDLELLRVLAQQLATAADAHADQIVRRSGEELGALALHDEANAAMIADKIDQLIRLCRRSA